MLSNTLFAAAMTIAASAAVRIGTVDCSYGDDASKTAIITGTNYLNGKQNCEISGNSRVSCSNDAAIYVFSQTGSFNEESCQDIATAANAIVGQCASGNNVHGQVPVNGGDEQGGFFVQVTHDSC